jgi:hypothetical protein
MITEAIYEFEETEQFEYIWRLHQLENEIATLKGNIENEKEQCSRSILLLEATMKIIKPIKAAIEGFDGQLINEDHAWGRYWGIHHVCEDVVFELGKLVAWPEGM